VSWGRKDKEKLVVEAVKRVLERPDSASLYLLAYAGMKSTRPDAGLLLSELAAIIHRVCRGNSPICDKCPHNLTTTVLHDRISEYAKVSNWETDWRISDEVEIHEKIHCRPCPHWGKRQP